MLRSLLTAGLLLTIMTLLLPKSDGQPTPKMLKVGIIGLDTSHVTAFTKLLNQPNPPEPVAGFKVVAAFPGGSQDIPDSANRLAGFTKTLREQYQVEMVDSIETLLTKVDVVLLESVDGRPHYHQALPVLKAGKPIFIDKPIAGSLVDVLRIFEAAAKYKTPCFSSSSLRFSAGIRNLRQDPKLGKVLGCDVYGPCALELHHPDLYWYGIHGVETLYTIMGTGCERVTRAHTKGLDVVTGTWQDGRIATFRGIRSGKSGYGGTVFGSDAIVPVGKYEGYEPLVAEICKFFRTGIAPVSAAETTEMFTFMEAADESKRQEGRPVLLDTVLQKARILVDAPK